MPRSNSRAIPGIRIVLAYSRRSFSRRGRRSDRPAERLLRLTRFHSGAFDDHAIDLGRAGATDVRPCFAFRTQDASGPYQTSGCLMGDHIEGQTWSEWRRFLLTGNAVRATE